MFIAWDVLRRCNKPSLPLKCIAASRARRATDTNRRPWSAWGSCHRAVYSLAPPSPTQSFSSARPSSWGLWPNTWACTERTGWRRTWARRQAWACPLLQPHKYSSVLILNATWGFACPSTRMQGCLGPAGEGCTRDTGHQRHQLVHHHRRSPLRCRAHGPLPHQ